MDFCALALNLGSVADWAAVIVAIAIGVIASRLTAAANRVADEAQQSRKETDRKETLQVSLLCYNEMAAARSVIKITRELLETEKSREHFLNLSDFRAIACVNVLTLKRSESGQDYAMLAKFPDDVGANIRLAWTWIETTQELAKDLRDTKMSASAMASTLTRFVLALEKAERIVDTAANDALCVAMQSHKQTSSQP